MKTLKIIGLIVLIIIVLVLSVQYYRCYTKGKEQAKDNKKPFDCGFFSAKPKFIQPEEIRYRVREGKCYEITDYGRKMTRREVEMINCEDE